MTGVTSLLIQKEKGRAAWSPNKLADTPLEPVLANFYDPESTFLEKVPATTFSTPNGKYVKTNPMRFSLLSEEEIGRLIRGEHPSSSSVAFTLEELVEKVKALSGGKQGVEEKVKDVVRRRCQEVPKSGMQEGHLRWIH